MSTVEVEELKKKINLVSDQNKELDNKIDSVDNKVDRILYYMNDDPLTGSIGLVQKVKHTEFNIQALTSKLMDVEQERKIELAVKKATIRTWAIIAGFGGGVAGWLFKFILGILLKGVL